MSLEEAGGIPPEFVLVADCPVAFLSWQDYSPFNPNRHTHKELNEMEAHKSDLLIMGSGLAGLQAAVAAKRAGGPKFRVTLLSCAAENAYGGCSYKTHGTNAAMNVGDDVQDHILDTWNGGGRLGDLALIQEMCRRVPTEIRALERLGVAFDRGDDGQYLAGYYGGSTRPRSVHRSDMAGKAMVDVLLAEAQKRGVFILHQRQTVGLIMAQGVCSGAYVLNLATNTVESFEATSTISALGGGACVYPIATISADKTSAGIVQAYEAGAGLVDMEMVQFHPTGLNKPNGPGHGEILEEELRSMGARFINGEGERYMPRYDERAERATRDVVSRGSYTEIIEGRGTVNNGVILDLSCIDKDTLLARFPFMVKRARSHGVDLIAQDQVETSPAAHFLMGGIKIDSSGGTEIANLYACGEDAGGIHGGNRLGGNGVADALVFGRIAGEAAAGRGASTLGRRFDPHYVPTYVDLDAGAARGVVSELKKLMWECAGPVRNGNDLVSARKGITQIEDRLSAHRQLVPVENFHLGDLEGRLLVQHLTLARMIVQSAFAREDSVGSHYRVDATQSRCTYNVRVSSKADGSMGVERRYVDQSRPEMITTIHDAIEDGPVATSA